MEIQEKNVQTLHVLGLTPSQAKIYLALVQTGKEKIQTISGIANLDRSNTHHTVMQLEKIGLISRILGTPNRYQAIPLKDGVSILLKHKQDQYGEIEKKAQNLIQIAQAQNAEPQEEYIFKIIKEEKEIEIKSIINSCENAQENFDLLINEKTFYGGVMDLAKDQLSCIKRGVKYRVVTEKINLQPIQKNLQAFLAEPNFQIRYISKAPTAQLILCDKKRATVRLLPNSGIGESSILITNHSGCVEMFQSHFDKIWNEAQEYKLKNNKAT